MGPDREAPGPVRRQEELGESMGQILTVVFHEKEQARWVGKQSKKLQQALGYKGGPQLSGN